MLYYLFDWLHKLNFPGAGMFGYTSFRALMAIILALLISSIWGDKFIKLLKRKQITETQRDAKIDPFGVNKVGVPSMGGVIIIRRHHISALYHIHAQSVDDQIHLFEAVGLQQSDNTICISDGRDLRCCYHQCPVGPGNSILEALFNSRRAVQNDVIKLFSQVVDHLSLSPRSALL